MNCSNADLGRALGLDHSTVSRMRSGTRTGSVATLRKLARISGRPLEEVLDAADHAREGNLEVWTAILNAACGGEATDEG